MIFVNSLFPVCVYLDWLSGGAETLRVMDFAALTWGEVRSLSGHDRGLSARSFFNLDELDRSSEAVVVRAPTNLDALTPSFLQGLFAASLRRLGEKQFYAHYHFELPSDLMSDIRVGVDRIQMQRQIAGQEDRVRA